MKICTSLFNSNKNEQFSTSDMRNYSRIRLTHSVTTKVNVGFVAIGLVLISTVNFTLASTI